MNIYPYRLGSRSASALAEGLGVKQIRHERSRFRGSPNKTVLNWGSSNLPSEVLKCRVINKEASVRVASNKLLTFQALKAAGLSVPEYTSAEDTAISWIEKGYTVVARKTLTGHSGQGIEILSRGADFVSAPLYTQYIPKDKEYRLHVVGKEVVDVQRKIKDPTRDVLDWKVRSHGNGFIFARNDDAGRPYKDTLEKGISDAAVLAVTALGLDFAGVDIVYNKRRGAFFILEANTACGLEGSTVDNYCTAFRKYL